MPASPLDQEFLGDRQISIWGPHLYGLLSTTMTKTQIIIIDTELSTPTSDLDYTERLMIAGDAEHPPLIPYYSGH